MKALVTGATGFIGARLVDALRRRNDDVIALARKPKSGERYADITKPDTLVGICAGVDAVFHLAGYAHADDADDPFAARIHQDVTVEGTRILLQEARRSGVKRFVFASSVKAMGEGGVACQDETSVVQPETAYGRAKRDAETLVLAAGKAELGVTVLRLPLVYGSSAKGNVARLVAAIDRGHFPPLPRVANKRSMVHVDDVVRAMLLAVESTASTGQVYIVTDEKVYSTYDIYSAIRQSLDRPPARWTMPMGLLKLSARAGDAISRLQGKPFMLNSRVLEKLMSSAWYSSAKISRELGFRAQHSLETALPEMVATYRRDGVRVG